MSVYDVINVPAIMPVIQLADAEAAQIEMGQMREMVLGMSREIQAQYVEACLWDVIQKQIYDFRMLHQVGSVYLIKFALEADPVVPFMVPQLVGQAVRSFYISCMGQLIHLLVEINKKRQQPTADQRAQLAQLVQQLTPMIAYTGENSTEAVAFWYSQLRLTASDPQRIAYYRCKY